MAEPARILGAMFQGGGNVQLIMPIMTRLVERGHSVRIIAGPGVRPSNLPLSPDLVHRISSAGATLVPFRIPDLHPLDAAPPSKGVLGSWVPAGFKSLPGEARTAAWATAWSLQVAQELQTAPADVVVADFVLLGALVAAEAARVPSVALMHTVAVAASVRHSSVWSWVVACPWTNWSCSGCTRPGYRQLRVSSQCTAGAQ